MYERIIFGAEADLRALMHIPDNYKVLFLQGGASLQFSMVPMNLYRNSFSADFIDTGSWTQKAMKECQKIGKVNVLASSKADNFAYIPQVDPQKMDPNADFLYIVTNNTIFGTRYTSLPTPPAGVPLVADASSNILSEEMDVEKFGLLYFGAQKNVGPAGLCVVYDCIDTSKLYRGTVEKKDRSLMNVTFVLPSEELNKKFVAQAEAAGLVNLKGHRSVGGIRASIYNAMPVEGVQALVQFMERFERENA